MKRTNRRGKGITAPAIDRVAFGKRVKAARLRRGWKYQCDLGAALGVTVGIISSWESGRSLPSCASLVALTFVLKRKTDFLVFGGRDYWWRAGRRSPDLD